MESYKFTYPIQVRYADLDPQWHVNNSRYLSFLEAARVTYLKELGLWDGKDFMHLGLIVANININYIKPITLGQNIIIGLKVTRLGNKSIDFSYSIWDMETEEVLSTATTVMVTYSYEALSAVPIFDLWRKNIAEFEGIPEKS